MQVLRATTTRSWRIDYLEFWGIRQQIATKIKEAEDRKAQFIDVMQERRDVRAEQKRQLDELSNEIKNRTK